MNATNVTGEFVNAPTEPAPAFIGRASFSPEDNKIRIYPFDQLDRETYARVRNAGFGWAPKQGIFVAPMWTPERADLAEELCGEIGDEDTSLADRAEERADRFEVYSEKREAEAHRAKEAVEQITNGIPFGQPILAGHHSERRARKDAARIESGLKKSVKLWETSKYWTDRAAGAIRAAKYKEVPAVRHRRIKGLEADKRKHEKRIAEAEHYSRVWNTGELTAERATKIANFDHQSVPPSEAAPYGDSLWSALDKGRMTPEAARELAMAKHERTVAAARRWIAQIDNRLAYERAMLAESGGVVTDHHDLAIGGRVLVRSFRGVEEWAVVLKLNASKATKEIVSVRTSIGIVPVEGIRGYRAPVAEDLAAVAKVKTASKLAPIINVRTPGCIEMTSAQWKLRANSDVVSIQRIKATAEHGAHRRREGLLPGGSWKYAPVFLTDAKIVEVPNASEVPNGSTGSTETAPTFEREFVEPKPRAPKVEPKASPFDAVKETLRAGVQVVVADQLFVTPPDLAARLVSEAKIQPGESVLEPSAGTGNIVAAIRSAGGKPTCVEINRKLCDLNGGASCEFPEDRWICADFLSLDPKNFQPFDVVCANPPFAAGADVAHVMHAFSFLKPGGRLVAIMSAGVKFKTDRKTEAFRARVESVGGTIEDLPVDSFKTSGTGVRTVIVTMTRPT